MPVEGGVYAEVMQRPARGIAPMVMLGYPRLRSEEVNQGQHSRWVIITKLSQPWVRLLRLGDGLLGGVDGYVSAEGGPP